MEPGSATTALITGASSGIGLELTRLFARDGHDLILVARNREKLAELSEDLTREEGIRVTVIPRDLSDPEAPEEIFRELGDRSCFPEILVNNAGQGLTGAFSGTDLASELSIIQVNITALVRLTKLALPEMLRRGRGKIMNVASTAAFQPGPFMAIYYASKSFVLSFSEAIASELAGTGVTVTALCPGPTKTGFQQKAKMERSRLFRMGMVMGAREVAEIGYRGLLEGRSLVVPGLVNRLLVRSVRFTPRKLVLKITRKLNRP